MTSIWLLGKSKDAILHDAGLMVKEAREIFAKIQVHISEEENIVLTEMARE
jgi:hypothetical protein